MTNVRKRYRALLARPGLLITPGVYDALSARIAVAHGFEAIGAGGYAAVGSMLGAPDIGQSNMRDYADHYARIASGVDVPVSVDGDTGFGDVHNVRQMVRAFEAAGVAGLMLSDQVFPNRCGYLPGKAVIPVEHMLAKLKAALDARRDPDLVIIARTDAFSIGGIEEAIERCQAFMDAGADVAKPQGVDGAEDIKRVIAEVPGPFIATLSQAAGKAGLDLADLEKLGAAAVHLPSISLFAASRGVSEVLGSIRQFRSIAQVQDKLLPLDDYYSLVGLDQEFQREESYHREAARLLEARQSRPGGNRTTGNPIVPSGSDDGRRGNAEEG